MTYLLWFYFDALTMYPNFVENSLNFMGVLIYKILKFHQQFSWRNFLTFIDEISDIYEQIWRRTPKNFSEFHQQILMTPLFFNFHRI
jgi:hypothetical protein